MAFIVGITNILPHGRFLFFYEYDNFSLDQAQEEANFLSQIGEIDIDLLESSLSHFHLVSYDILSRSEVLRLQNLSTEQGHYLHNDETELYSNIPQGCTLRLSEKFDKPKPKFLQRFSNNGRHSKSLKHFRYYRFYVDVPKFKKEEKFRNLKADLVIYRTGRGVKKVLETSPLSHKINQELKEAENRLLYSKFHPVDEKVFVSQVLNQKLCYEKDCRKCFRLFHEDFFWYCPFGKEPNRKPYITRI